MARHIALKHLPGLYSVCRLDKSETIPSWADGDGFVSISRTDDELSVVCLADRVPAQVRADRDWTCFKFQGPFEFNQTGIALSVIQPLSDAGIGIFLISTFDTDYLLVKAADAAAAITAMEHAGHTLAF